MIPYCIPCFSFSFLSSFHMCVYVGVQDMCSFVDACLCMCTYVCVNMSVWGLRLIIKSQLWSVLHLIHLNHWGSRQGLSPNPGSPTQPRVSQPNSGLFTLFTEAESPSPTQALMIWLVSLARLLWRSPVSTSWDWIYRQASTPTQHLCGFLGSKLWLSYSLCKHFNDWAVSLAPRTLILNLNIYPFR